MPKALDSERDLIELLHHWPFLGPATLQPTHWGASNTTYIVDAPAGKFILKLYGSTTSTAQIQYEHRLLSHLQKARLSFAVPTPLPAPSGETLISIGGSDTPLRIALLHWLPGQHTNRDNLSHTHAAGRTLGELHGALAQIDPADEPVLPPWGALYQIHPLVTDPLAITKSLPLDENQRRRLERTFIEVLEVKPHLYATLPLQIVHADYLCCNVLIEGEQVSGVIDFEFATVDLRFMDFIAGLDHFAFPWKAPRWDFVEAFITGYNQSVLLTLQELEALSLVWRLQRASCLVYWTGLLYEEKATLKSVVDAVVDTLHLEDWLKQSGNLRCYFQ